MTLYQSTLNSQLALSKGVCRTHLSQRIQKDLANSIRMTDTDFIVTNSNEVA